MEIRIKKLRPDAIVPRYAHDGDAGIDLYCIEDVTIVPGERALVGTGLSMEIPKGFVSLLWDRSGLAAKKGLHVLGGVIDATYRGEYKVILINLGSETVMLHKGERVAQMLLQEVAHATITEVEELSETARGEGGFGSTGTQ